MKKYILLFLLIDVFIHCDAQNNKWKEILLKNPSAYQSNGLQLQLFKQTYAGLTGQQYTVKLSNLTVHKIKVTGTLIAYTYCNAQVTTKIDVTINPGKTLGGIDYSFDADGLTGVVSASDCRTDKLYPYPGDKTRYEYDRISALGVSSISINSIADDYTTSSSNTSVSQPSAGNTQTNTSSKTTTSNTYTTPRTTTPKTYTPPTTTSINTNPLSDAINTFGNSLIQLQQEKARQREEEYAKQQQASNEKRAKEEAEQEERRQQEREQQEELQRERDAGRADRNADFVIDMEIGARYYGNYPFRKPSNIETEHPNIKTIYYVAYCHMDNVVTIMPPLTINKYSDDSWMLTENLMAKITPLFGYTIKEFEGGISANKLITLGYFTDAATANAAFNTIKQNAVNKGYTIHLTAEQKMKNTTPAASKPTSKPNSKDFWNN